MFEDQPKNSVTPPINLPTEPADMFAGIEESEKGPTPEKIPNALESGLLKKKISGAPVPAPLGGSSGVVPEVAPMALAKPPILGKILLFLIMASILGGVGFGGWWIYMQYKAGLLPVAPSKTPTTPVVVPPVQNTQSAPAEPPLSTPSVTAPVVQLSTSSVNTKINNDTILFGNPVDSDRDSLSDDDEENKYHTNPSNADSDNDGVNDGDEVRIWGTNPLNPDTDGDGWPDSEEVQNGYNPLGRGRMSSTSTPGSAATTTFSTTTK